MVKLTYEFVKEQIEKVGYTLISTEYIDARSKLNVCCDKGHNYFVTYSSFKSGHRCLKCSHIKNGEEKRLSYEYVKSEFEKFGYTLLSKEYVTAHSKLECICDKGHTNFIKYNNFKNGKRCMACHKINNIGENHPNWIGGTRKFNIPMYNTYAHQLDWVEEVRQDPKNNDLLQVRCTNCQEWFTPKRTHVITRIGALNFNKRGESRFYCSDTCKKSCSIYKKVLYPKNYKPYYDKGVSKDLSLMVLERDGYECQRCGNKADLECHHYESIYSNPIESADIDVCVTLCHKCHKKAHKDKGCRYTDLRRDNLC